MMKPSVYKTILHKNWTILNSGGISHASTRKARKFFWWSARRVEAQAGCSCRELSKLNRENLYRVVSRKGNRVDQFEFCFVRARLKLF